MENLGLPVDPKFPVRRSGAYRFVKRYPISLSPNREKACGKGVRVRPVKILTRKIRILIREVTVLRENKRDL